MITLKSYQSVNSFNVDCSIHYVHDHLRSMNFMRASKNVLIHASTIYMQYASIFVALKLCHLPILICSVVVWPTIFLSSYLCILFLFVLFHTSLLLMFLCADIICHQRLVLCTSVRMQ